MELAIQASPAQPPAASLRQSRSVLLDCIRAAAILSVVVFHVATRYDTAELDTVATLARRYGLLGVDVFFPLSGFLITRYLIESRDSHCVQEFFVHRLLRIVPLYLIAVTVYYGASVLFSYDSTNLDLIWAVYIFLTGWFIFFSGEGAVPFTITWSLSVEVFAYILFGILAWVSKRYLIVFLIAVSIFVVAFRYHLEYNSYLGIYTFPLARLDSIAIGGVVAILAHLKVRGLLAGLGIATLVIYFVSTPSPILWSTLKYTFITLGTCFLIAASEARPLAGSSSRVLRYFSSIGFYSYFTYLFHLFNIHFLLEVSKMFTDGSIPFWPMVVAAMALTQFQAVISFRFFEGPIIRYGKRWRPSRRPILARTVPDGHPALRSQVDPSGDDRSAVGERRSPGIQRHKSAH